MERGERRHRKITAVPARHGPPGSESLTGPVCGFVIRGTQMPGVYASGDNTSLEVVEEVAARLGGIDVAMINAGAAQLPYIGEGHLTLSATETLEAARILAAGRVIPLHHEGWAHYTEGRRELLEAFDGTELEDALELPGPTDG